MIAVFLTGALMLTAAHHSVNASHDSTKPVTIQGTIVKVEWVNPHSRITLQVKSDNGQVSTQVLEMGRPARNGAGGIDRSLFQVGKTITVEAWAPKPEYKDDMFSARFLILDDGRRIDVHDTWGEPGSFGPIPK